MNTHLIAGVIILLSISIIVRIAPAFLKHRLSTKTLNDIEQTLPICVFIPMAVYFLITELQKDFVPALIAFAFILVATFTIKNNIVTIMGSILLFITVKNTF